MNSIPAKSYFAKELALRTLLGDKAFSDFKRLMDPCCGIGIDNICTSPCVTPKSTLIIRYDIKCTGNPDEYHIKGYAKSSIAIPSQLGVAVVSPNPTMKPLIQPGSVILYIPDLEPDVEVLIAEETVTSAGLDGAVFYTFFQTFTGIKTGIFTVTYPKC